MSRRGWKGPLSAPGDLPPIRLACRDAEECRVVIEEIRSRLNLREMVKRVVALRRPYEEASIFDLANYPRATTGKPNPGAFRLAFGKDNHLFVVELELRRAESALSHPGGLREARAVLEQVMLLESEQYQRGRRELETSRKGHEKRWGTLREKRSRWAEWQRWIDERHSRYPKHSYNALTKAAADHFGVSQRTIKERTEPPVPSGS